MKPVVLIKNGCVVQRWVSGKTLEQLHYKFPQADIRQVDAMCGQIDTGNGVFTNPDIEPKSANELDRFALEINQHKAMELIAHLASDINQSDKNILSPKTKALAQELKALLRP